MDLDNLTEDQVIQLLIENPRILIRPLLADGEKVLLRFKEEQYQQALIDS